MLLAHERDDLGLRDRLAVSNGKWPICIGLAAERFRHKQMPGHAAHCLEHAAVDPLRGHRVGGVSGVRLNDPDHLGALTGIIAFRKCLSGRADQEVRTESQAKYLPEP